MSFSILVCHELYQLVKVTIAIQGLVLDRILLDQSVQRLPPIDLSIRLDKIYRTCRPRRIFNVRS